MRKHAPFTQPEPGVPAEPRVRGAMKALSSPESSGKKARRVSKPLMEKRRRERINHSLETLRLLMLENTHDEKLRNPKVEKAEILESVVDFLRAEKDVEKGHHGVGRALSQQQGPTCPRQRSYGDGVRSCLLRVSQFIAAKSGQLQGPGHHAAQDATLPPPPAHRPTGPPPADSEPLTPQHRLTQPPRLHGDTSKFLSAPAGSAHISDPVWRPWPE